MNRVEDLATRWSPAVCRVVAYAAAALACAPFVYHLARGSSAYLGLFEDDYLYYAVIVDNLVGHGRLTFDGTTITNGFHPLWFALLAVLRFLSGSLGPTFHAALAVVFFACMVATYELGVRFARAIGASPPLAPAIAAAQSVAADQILSSGMEAAIAVPLSLWLLVESARDAGLTARRAAGLGFIASLAVLARLDLALMVGLLVAAWLAFARPRPAAALRALVAFGAGGVLLPLYAAANVFFFGSVLPLSAQAKQLLTGRGFNLVYAWIVAVGTPYGRTAALLLPLGLVALLLLWRDPAPRPAARVAGGVALIFAFLFYLVNAMTGWAWFGWYAYPMVAAMLAALCFVCEKWSATIRWQPARIAIAAAVVLIVPAAAARNFVRHGPLWTTAENPMLAMSLELTDRLRGREGRYAMGAMGGFVAQALQKPLVQLEGLVADQAMIEHLRRQDALEDVLAAYRVDYLIVALAMERPQLHDGCYVLTEPDAMWSGKRAKKMRGELCAEPIVHFFTPRGPHSWSELWPIETLVFDLRGARWRRPVSATAR